MDVSATIVLNIQFIFNIILNVFSFYIVLLGNNVKNFYSMMPRLNKYLMMNISIWAVEAKLFKMQDISY